MITDAASAPELGLHVARDGSSLRVIEPAAAGCFRGTDPQAFVASVREAVNAVRLHEEPVIVNGEPLALEPDARRALRLAIALHWIRYFLSVGEPVALGPSEQAHPQTWDLVLRAAEGAFGPRSPRAVAWAAHALGIATAELERWRRVEDDRQSRM